MVKVEIFKVDKKKEADRYQEYLKKMNQKKGEQKKWTERK